MSDDGAARDFGLFAATLDLAGEHGLRLEPFQLALVAALERGLPDRTAQAELELAQRRAGRREGAALALAAAIAAGHDARIAVALESDGEDLVRRADRYLVGYAAALDLDLEDLRARAAAAIVRPRAGTGLDGGLRITSTELGELDRF